MSKDKDAAYWIRKLDLTPHPEGGYYRQTYSADLVLPKDSLPPDFTGPRPASTAIYFLLDAKNFLFSTVCDPTNFGTSMQEERCWCM
jgi:predicted cupin superfamily sugar epimerase